MQVPGAVCTSTPQQVLWGARHCAMRGGGVCPAPRSGWQPGRCWSCNHIKKNTQATRPAARSPARTLAPQQVD